MAEITAPFYLSLPSNASGEHYPNNKPQEYKVKLPKTLILRGDWEVALVEIYTPGIYVNVESDIDVRVTMRMGSHQEKNIRELPLNTVLKSGYYESVSKVCEQLTKVINEEFSNEITVNRRTEWGTNPEIINFSFNEVSGLIDVSKIIDDNIRMSLKISAGQPTYQLGFAMNKDTDFVEFVPCRSVKEANLTRQYPALFVYCNIIENQMVGDTFAPLLRTVPIKSMHRDLLTESFIRPYYLRVRNEYISEIEVNICTDSGTLFHFINGKSNLMLHFRRTAINL